MGKPEEVGAEVDQWQKDGSQKDKEKNGKGLRGSDFEPRNARNTRSHGVSNGHDPEDGVHRS
jgi:hypothetical protein